MDAADQTPSPRDALKRIGRNVHAARVQLDSGRTQEHLADLAGLHRTRIGQIERGEANFSIVTLLRMAKALQVEPGTLLQGIDLEAFDAARSDAL